jgi:hypothetical protein
VFSCAPRRGSNAIHIGLDDTDLRGLNATVFREFIEKAYVLERDKHTNNALAEELADFSVVAKFATTAADGKLY